MTERPIGPPPERPSIDDVAPLIPAFYAIDGNGTGGVLHIVLDDNNVEDDNVDFCIRQAMAGPSTWSRGDGWIEPWFTGESVDPRGERLARVLRRMRRWERHRLARTEDDRYFHEHPGAEDEFDALWSAFPFAEVIDFECRLAAQLAWNDLSDWPVRAPKAKPWQEVGSIFGVDEHGRCRNCGTLHRKPDVCQAPTAANGALPVVYDTDAAMSAWPRRPKPDNEAQRQFDGAVEARVRAEAEGDWPPGLSRGYADAETPFVRGVNERGERYEARVSLDAGGRARAEAIAQHLGLGRMGWLTVTVLILNAELDRMQGLDNRHRDALHALQRELGVPVQDPPDVEVVADPNTWFVLICRDCGDGDDALPMPFETEEKRRAWATAHMESGHNRFYAIEHPR